MMYGSAIILEHGRQFCTAHVLSRNLPNFIARTACTGFSLNVRAVGLAVKYLVNTWNTSSYRLNYAGGFINHFPTRYEKGYAQLDPFNEARTHHWPSICKWKGIGHKTLIRATESPGHVTTIMATNNELADAGNWVMCPQIGHYIIQWAFAMGGIRSLNPL